MLAQTRSTNVTPPTRDGTQLLSCLFARLFVTTYKAQLLVHVQMMTMMMMTLCVRVRVGGVCLACEVILRPWRRWRRAAECGGGRSFLATFLLRALQGPASKPCSGFVVEIA